MLHDSCANVASSDLICQSLVRHSDRESVDRGVERQHRALPCVVEVRVERGSADYIPRTREACDAVEGDIACGVSYRNVLYTCSRNSDDRSVSSPQTL